MKQRWICEKCGEEFENEQECLEHEKKCNPMITYVCHKCGKKVSYKPDENMETEWHSFDLGTPGYYSKLDGKNVAFTLCDNCLSNIVDSFVYKDMILNSNEDCWENHYDDKWNELCGID